MEVTEQASFRTFEDLEVYQLARQFRKVMYKVSRGLPELEKYNLADQIRRAAISVTNNIAEGHGRHHYLDQLRFLLQARGSLEELMDDLNVCADEAYLSESALSEVRKLGWRVHNLINGYGRYLRKRKACKPDTLRDSSPEYKTENDPAHYGLDMEADPF